jgi:carbamoyltransferase
MEWGPRALGNRSILADPRSTDMQQHLNLKIKYRESFRPFAPAVLEEDAQDYFNLTVPSPYMLLVGSVTESQKLDHTNESDLNGLEKLKIPRSRINAVTHVDYSARIQTVSKFSNPLFWELLQSFKALTGCGVLANTSFNVRGEPIVCTPEDAVRCFFDTEMDILVMGPYILDKSFQTAFPTLERHCFEKD